MGGTKPGRDVARATATRKGALARVKVISASKGALQVKPADGDDQSIANTWRRATGSQSLDFSDALINQVLGGMALPADAPADTQELRVNAMVAALCGIAPRDELEGMLASQFVLAHDMTITMLRRLKGSQTVEQQDSAANALSKLVRAEASLIDALTRYRGKGTTEQRVVVEHVTVEAGGQAIVGAVKACAKTRRGEGG